jgi:hypothetical protein
MQVELICTQVQVPPRAFPMIVHRAFAPALGTTPGAFPFESNVNTLALQIELRFDHFPGVFDAEQLTYEFGVAQYPAVYVTRLRSSCFAHHKFRSASN